MSTKIFKPFVFIFLSFLFLTGCGQVAAQTISQTTQDEKGFSSPEKAGAAYLEALRDSDLQRMRSTFAIEKYVKNYDFEAYLERMGGYTRDFISEGVPNFSALATEMNSELREQAVTEEIAEQYTYLSFVLSRSEFPDDLRTMEELPSKIFFD